MISSEKAEKIAQDLFRLANILGEQINVIDNMGREGWQAIKDEMDAYETTILKGTDVMVALKTIAMRLDRAALIKSQKSD